MSAAIPESVEAFIARWQSAGFVDYYRRGALVIEAKMLWIPAHVGMSWQGLGHITQLGHSQQFSGV